MIDPKFRAMLLNSNKRVWRYGSFVVKRNDKSKEEFFIITQEGEEHEVDYASNCLASPFFTQEGDRIYEHDRLKLIVKGKSVIGSLEMQEYGWFFNADDGNGNYLLLIPGIDYDKIKHVGDDMKGPF
jgi:hypothetical protein